MRIPKTPIIVDEFKFVPGVYVYLLTHLHTDHTAGLKPSWNCGTIYCSKVTKELLLEKFKVNSDFVVALDEDKVHQIPLDSSKTITMQVKIIDANHCPGSVMFLLEGYFGTILHTGDFRFDSKILEHIKDKQIDILYLDDTFCSPEYDFPPRNDAGNDIVSIIKQIPEDVKIYIAVDTLGKEELLVALAFQFKTLIVVNEERLKMINSIKEICNIPDVFTHDSSLGRIHVIPKKELNYQKIVEERKIRPVVGIFPSGLNIHAMKKEEKFKRKAIYRVPYSLHSSYNELLFFVKSISPKRLFSVSRNDNVSLQNEFKEYLNKQESKSFEIPISVQLSMETKQQKIEVSTKKIQTPKKFKLKKKKMIKGAKITSSETESIDLTSESEKEYSMKEKDTKDGTIELLKILENFSQSEDEVSDDDEFVSALEKFKNSDTTQSIDDSWTVQSTFVEEFSSTSVEINDIHLDDETQIPEEIETTLIKEEIIDLECSDEEEEEEIKTSKKRPSPSKLFNETKKTKFDLFSIWEKEKETKMKKEEELVIINLD